MKGLKMNLQETKALLTLISVRDHRKIDNAVATAWHEDINPDISFSTACKIVTRFFSDPDMLGKYLDARYINRAWRDMKNSAKPTENQITAETLALGFDDGTDEGMWKTWMYRAQRLQGKTPEHCAEIARHYNGHNRTECEAMHTQDTRRIESAAPQPKRGGMASIGSIVPTR